MRRGRHFEEFQVTTVREDRLLEVTVIDHDDDEAHEAETVLLAYDGLGRRLVWEAVEEDHEDHNEATRIEYLFDGLDPVAEYDVDRGSWRYDDRGALGRIVSSRRGFPPAPARLSGQR